MNAELEMRLKTLQSLRFYNKQGHEGRPKPMRGTSSSMSQLRRIATRAITIASIRPLFHRCIRFAARW